MPTPSSSSRCLKAGKHVYCEKPFANRARRGQRRLDACPQAAIRVVTLGTQRRSDPRYLAAAEFDAHRRPGPGRAGGHRAERLLALSLAARRRRQGPQGKDTDWKAFLMGRPDRPFDPRHYLEFRLFQRLLAPASSTSG